LTNTPNNTKNGKNTIPMEQEIRGLHDEEKKVQVFKELKKFNNTTKQISVKELSKIVKYDVPKLTIFLEELILADKINAKMLDDVISFL